MEPGAADELFDRSVNSKLSDWTAVFDPRELDAYRLDWRASARASPERSRRSSDGGDGAEILAQKVGT